MSEKLKKPKKLIGRAEPVVLADHGEHTVTARIDTGAKSSSIWATNMIEKDDVLYFTLFGPASQFYTGYQHHTKHFWKTVVSSSMGTKQERYVVRLKVKLRKKNIVARFTLADRSTQVYPVLVGRNVLRGKFVVDVNLGKPDRIGEEKRSQALQSELK